MHITSKLFVAGLIGVSLSGCATFVAPNYSPSYEEIDRLKKLSADHFSIDPVQPTDPSAKVNRITLRGTSMQSPYGTYSKYLENALISDLTEMGVYDASSASRINVLILKNDIDISGFSVGTGVLEANIKVSRSGNVVLDKTYKTETKFESSFAGIVAIPKGQSEYPNLVRAFLKDVYNDSSFIEALKK